MEVTYPLFVFFLRDLHMIQVVNHRDDHS